VSTLPDLPKHAGDRNRTSPFAFTGNKFEFRALGGSQSISFSATVLNTIVAEAIDEMCGSLEEQMGRGEDMDSALVALLADEVPRIKRIVFNGDGYSDEWQDEAARRGLLNRRTTLEALPALVADKNVQLFEKYGVLTSRESHARFEIALEQYFMTINIEGEAAEHIGQTMVLPAAIRYLGELAAAAAAVEGAGSKGLGTTLQDVGILVDELVETLALLEVQNADLGGDEIGEKARHMAERIIPAMGRVRAVADQLEKIVPDDLWPLPTYRDMLFIK